jgi:hypothetical protein
MAMQNSGEMLHGPLAAIAIQRAEERHKGAGGGQGKPSEYRGPGVPYKLLCREHPSRDAAQWARLRALYKGGEAIFKDARVCEEVFPRHRDEHPAIYLERVTRAYYIPYAGEIIGHLVSAIAEQSLSMSTGGDESEDAYPAFYDEFFGDVSKAGGRTVSIDQLLKELIETALVCGCAWTLVELPAMRNEQGEPLQFGSQYDQEKAGALRAYAMPIAPECVLDWEETDNGQLKWALLYFEDRPRETLFDDRNKIRRTWWYYDKEKWAKLEIVVKEDQEIRDEQIIPLIDEGAHTFQRVPLARMVLPAGLWAMDKLGRMASAHLNLRSGLHWAQTQSAFQDLYEFQDNQRRSGVRVEEGMASDPDRAINQTRGPGYVQVRGKEDDARFVGPDPASFDQILKSCTDIRDDMHRVTHQMALSTDNGAAALKRSGESKKQDKAAASVILRALGEHLREVALDIVRLVSLGRGEVELVAQWTAQGFEKFDLADVDGEVERGVLVKELDVPSPTFKKLSLLQLCKLILGDLATPEVVEAIEKELDENVVYEPLEETRTTIPGAEDEPEEQDDPEDA